MAFLSQHDQGCVPANTELMQQVYGLASLPLVELMAHFEPKCPHFKNKVKAQFGISIINTFRSTAQL